MGNLRMAALLAMVLVASPAAQAQEKTRGITDTEILIGTHTDLSGPAAFAGTSNVNGMQMRINEINEAGGVHGRKIRLIVEDHQYQVPRAVQAVNKLVNRDGVFLVIGAIGVAQNNAAMPILQKANVPNMFPLAQSRSMWEPLDRLKFVLHAGDYDQIRSGIKWLVDNKQRSKFCLLHLDTDFGKEIVDGTTDELAKHDLKVVASEKYKPTDTDLGTQILNLRKADCDVVVLGSLARDTVLAYTSARRVGWNVDFIGASSSYHRVIQEAANNATEGLYAVTGNYVPEPGERSPEYQAWYDKYKALYKTDPHALDNLGYLSIDVLAKAFDAAGKDLTLDTFITGMESIKDYQDLFGNPKQSWGPDDHQGSNTSTLTQLHDGIYVPIVRAAAYEK
ncbi:ABC transporter substrate-binding protein [Mesorhizobium sp. CGMCC 1.15528]|uniref:ABC transporter substrate-binding protein n=1 Tax=Mesorhizobium zhangyense TaxID=1776730 RepID=A0A7C9VGM4_9HYPH|nr:ABC transporter substrate-binding protein [Mesorhizobium zhangyense]NGN44552.1 ABC transporter substrate-binding protein [Mesorhizobium zhangyense]